jgi:hypothetical protein
MHLKTERRIDQRGKWQLDFVFSVYVMGEIPPVVAEIESGGMIEDALRGRLI